MPKQRVTTVFKSLEYCRKQGGYVAKVEHWNPHVKRRNDLFGFCDILWVTPDTIHHYVQSTTQNGISSHIEKILTNDVACALAKMPGVDIVLHAWARRVKKGRTRWDLRIIRPFHKSPELE